MGGEVKLSALLDRALRIDDCDVTGLALDSRIVKAGEAFFAISGTHQDGARYIDDAIAKGASAVIASGERPASVPAHIAFCSVQDVRSALALAAARFYPQQPKTIVAVTGTSGKTSVADFTRQIFMACGHKAASLGTLGVITHDRADYGSLTTPDPVALHRTLDRLAGEGVTHLAMEASSHGIDQKRLDGVRLNAAAFTNLGHDHLDYHGTMDAYLKAKLRLFETLLPQNGVAVINADSPEAQSVADIARARGQNLISVGAKGHDLKLVTHSRQGFDQLLQIDWRGASFSVALPLAGEFQVSNALVAAGLALAVGIKPESVLASLENLRGVKGRLERVAIHQGALIVIDYAHKPEALENALTALRPFSSGKLICIFGCGGDRDRGKRPVMGQIASRLADHVIVTDDNPRSEEPATIRSEIMIAARNATEIADRRAAIKHAMRMAKAGDVVLIAGKGHEVGQIFKDHVEPFSDHKEVEAIIREQA